MGTLRLDDHGTLHITVKTGGHEMHTENQQVLDELRAHLTREFHALMDKMLGSTVPVTGHLRMHVGTHVRRVIPQNKETRFINRRMLGGLPGVETVIFNMLFAAYRRNAGCTIADLSSSTGLPEKSIPKRVQNIRQRAVDVFPISKNGDEYRITSAPDLREYGYRGPIEDTTIVPMEVFEDEEAISDNEQPGSQA